MSTWKLLELASVTAAFAGIVWGVLRFFLPPRRPDARVRVVAAGAVGGYLNLLVAIWDSPGDPSRAAAALGAYALSVGIFWSAVRAVRADRAQALTAIFEEDVPRFIVDRGPYRIVRHPFYTSYSLFWLAGWIAASTWSTGAVAAIMTAIYVRAARLEEAKFAASSMAAQYTRYKSAAGFFWPRIGPRRRRERGVDAAPHAAR